MNKIVAFNITDIAGPSSIFSVIIFCFHRAMFRTKLKISNLILLLHVVVIIINQIFVFIFLLVENTSLK